MEIRIKIIVDSTCAPSEDYVKENEIYVNPLRILFEDKEYLFDYIKPLEYYCTEVAGTPHFDETVYKLIADYLGIAVN